MGVPVQSGTDGQGIQGMETTRGGGGRRDGNWASGFLRKLWIEHDEALQHDGALKHDGAIERG
jgi:hypothetical protein